VRWGRVGELSAEPAKARQYALKLLSYRSYSVEELRQRLQRKGFSSDAIDQIIPVMVDYGYLNDEAYARSLIELLIERRGYGSRRLLQELLSRGIDRGLAVELLGEISDSQEMERALSLARKKIRSFSRANRSKTYRRMASFLMRKGFPTEISRRVLEEILPPAEW